MIHNSCNTLTLSKFITCVCDDDYSVLVEDGSYTNEKITEAWQQVYTEYVTLTENTATIQAMALVDEINYWNLQHKVIVESVNLLKVWRSEELITILKEKGYLFEYSATDLDAYQKDLERVLTRSKTILVQQAERERELATLSKDNEGKKSTRADFDSNIIVMSKFMGVMINDNETTVARYAAILNLYYKNLDHLNSKGNG